MNDDITPEAIAARIVGDGDSPLLVEARRLVAAGIREDRCHGTAVECMRDALREVHRALLCASNVRSVTAAERARRSTFVEASGIVQDAIDRLGG